MTYWKLGSQTVKTPVLPYLAPGTQIEFTMTVVNEDATTWLKCYLYTSVDWEYLIEARKSGDSEWLPVSILGNPVCYIAHLDPGETDIEFRLTVPSDESVARYQVPVGIGHDAGSYRPKYHFVDWWLPLWAKCWEILPLWLTSWYREEVECAETVLVIGFADDWDDGFADVWGDGFEDSF